MSRVLLLAAMLVAPAFWWERHPPLQTAPVPPPSRVQYRTHDISGFKLTLGQKELVLPPGSELSIPYEVAPADSLPDWTKV